MALTGGLLEADDRVTRVPGSVRLGLVGALTGAVPGAVAFWLMHRALGDDALITVSYARTLAESGTWGAFPGLTANTQTSPLNAWLLAAGIALVGHPVLVAGVVFCVCLAACGWLATALARRVDCSPTAGWLAVAIIATSPVLVATVGLEACVSSAVLLGVAVAATTHRTVVTGLLCGAAVLTRPDLTVPAAILALALVAVPDATGDRRRPVQLVAVAAIAAVVALPWHVWSWFALGDAVPDTTWVRTGDRSGPSIIPAVAVWVRLYPAAAIGSVIPVLLALGCAVWAVRHRRRPWARTVLLLVAAGWGHLLALQAIHAQGAGWYYGPIVTCSAAAVGLTAATAGRKVALGGLVAVGGLALVGLLSSGPLPWTAAPLVANYARTEQYAAVAQELRQLTGGEAVEGPGEVGALAYYGSVPVLDFLTEPAQTDAVMAKRASEGGLRAELMRWSTQDRRSPPPVSTPWRLSWGSSGVPQGRVVRVWPIDSPNRGADTIVLSEKE
jgi:hypothetical protein